jgi:hypothetical protein
MRCPACGSTTIRERPGRTTQGCRRFRCRCGKQFNERSSDVLNKAQYGATVGDFLDKPISDGGLALSRPLASAVRSVHYRVLATLSPVGWLASP